MNAQDQTEYAGDSTTIPKNTSVLVYGTLPQPRRKTMQEKFEEYKQEQAIIYQANRIHPHSEKKVPDKKHRRSVNYINECVVPNHLECTLCRNIMKNAVIIKCCGRSFCEDCLSTKLQNYAACPACKASNVLYVSKVNNRLLAEKYC